MFQPWHPCIWKTEHACQHWRQPLPWLFRLKGSPSHAFPNASWTACYFTCRCPRQPRAAWSDRSSATFLQSSPPEQLPRHTLVFSADSAAWLSDTPSQSKKPKALGNTSLHPNGSASKHLHFYRAKYLLFPPAVQPSSGTFFCPFYRWELEAERPLLPDWDLGWSGMRTVLLQRLHVPAGWAQKEIVTAAAFLLPLHFMIPAKFPLAYGPLRTPARLHGPKLLHEFQPGSFFPTLMVLKRKQTMHWHL